MTMTFKTPTDFRKSLEARLKRIAEKTNQDLQRIRRKVAFERLLARIFHQDADGNFSSEKAIDDLYKARLLLVEQEHMVPLLSEIFEKTFENTEG